MTTQRHVLEASQIVKRPLREVFRFFADPENLDTITPPDLRFEILTKRPIAMRVGALIEYQLSLLGVRFRWLTRIDEFDPDQRFVDVQVRGPYRMWRHVHEFIEVTEGTLVRDRVEYELPFGWLGQLAHAMFVRSRLRRIFAHRRLRISELLDPEGARLISRPRPEWALNREG